MNGTLAVEADPNATNAGHGVVGAVFVVIFALVGICLVAKALRLLRKKHAPDKHHRYTLPRH
jgi:hypothetical protein